MVSSLKLIVVTIMVGSLLGCGGSGDSVTGTTVTAKPLGELVIVGDLTPAINQTVALVATVDNDLSDQATIKWSQTAGPSVELIAANSAVLAFDLSKTGHYSFSVDYIGRDGKLRNKTISLNPSNQVQSLNVRRDHAVREGNKVSFQLSAPVDPDTGDVVNGEYGAMTWLQTAGPTVSFDAENTNLMTQLFIAPTVTKDTLLRFKVTAIHPNGDTYHDDVYLLVQDHKIVENSLFGSGKSKIVAAKVVAFSSSSPYATALVDCVYNNTFTFADRCNTAKLPLIGQKTMTPTIADIMDRVVVSHPWMGTNFKKFLENEDIAGDFRKLLRSVNAIVLAYDVRPSFYWSATGAIYLDPENLWLTPAQRDTLNVAPDYRSAFGEELQYLMPWRYVKDNEYASSLYVPELRVSRTTFDLRSDLGSLLYHELAHASDIFPANTIADITENYLSSEAYKRRTVSDLLASRYPKNSVEMAKLGQVKFSGVAATQQQKDYTPSHITNFFSHDNAAIEYAYSSEAEDTATLFDATMMSVRYGIERDTAVTDSPTDATGWTIALDWGQRGRVNAVGVVDRAKFVLERLMPEANASELIAKLPPVVTLPPGYSWRGVLDPNNPKDQKPDETVNRVKAMGNKVTIDLRLIDDLKAIH
ncbi:MAG: hypothetical protein HRU24_13805 [Gammaproteobacteria bacterium]|nr:hypothetical protein [Gammaproteobacteria bacterium]